MWIIDIYKVWRARVDGGGWVYVMRMALVLLEFGSEFKVIQVVAVMLQGIQWVLKKI